jgi:hypothetical protein
LVGDSEVADESVGAMGKTRRVLEKFTVKKTHDLILSLRDEEEELGSPQVFLKMITKASFRPLTSVETGIEVAVEVDVLSPEFHDPVDIPVCGLAH